MTSGSTVFYCRLYVLHNSDSEKNFVGYSKNAILFPISGKRSLADEMANSDFDGDEYWVSRNHMVSSFMFFILCKFFRNLLFCLL